MAKALERNGDLTGAILNRRAQLPQRLMVAGIVGMVNIYLIGWEFPVAWLLAYALVQGLELLAFRPIYQNRTAPLPLWRSVAGYASFVVSGLIFGSITIPLWLLGGAFGGVAAVLILSAAVVNVVVTSGSSRGALACAVGPHFLYFCLTPFFLAMFGAGQALQSAVSLGSLVFCAYALVLWRSVDQARKSEAAAHEVSERKRLEAEAAVAAQNSFIATVSHELRTPISAMMAGASELGRSAHDAAGRNQAALIADAGRMMKALLDDLLDHAKLQAGRMSVEMTPFDLRTVTAQAARFWSVEARKKGLRLRVEGASSLPAWVVGDPIRLRQILNNLISNAVKFTETGSVTLRLSAWAAGDEEVALRFQVVDTGKGMDAEQIGRLFTPFEQGGAGVAGQYGGTGLGLSISRQLARLMGGHLTAFSVKGSGSVFTLALTFRMAEAPAREESTAEQTVRAAVPPPPPVEAEDTTVEVGGEDERPVRILIADDHEINRRAVQLVLEPMGAVITAVVNGQQAVEAAQAAAFDVIVMDVRMPELDGRAATRKIRSMAGPNQHVPVIAVTADTEDDDKAACRAAGMTDFVGKPIDPARLISAVVNALQGAELEQAPLDQDGRQVA